MKKKIIISAVSVGLALAVIGASVGTYMSYIKKYVPIAPPSALAYTKSNSQKVLLENADFYVSVNGDDNGDGTLEKPAQKREFHCIGVLALSRLVCARSVSIMRFSTTPESTKS
jgi:hypothetical protein